jgi:hypothetical protein
MRRKAALADGTRPGLPVCDLGTVERRIEGRMLQEPWTLPDEGRDGWEVARAALSVELCGSTQAAVALRLHCSDTRVGKLLALHRRLLRDDASYAERLGELAHEALRVWDDVGV